MCPSFYVFFVCYFHNHVNQSRFNIKCFFFLLSVGRIPCLSLWAFFFCLTLSTFAIVNAGYSAQGGIILPAPSLCLCHNNEKRLLSSTVTSLSSTHSLFSSLPLSVLAFISSACSVTEGGHVML